MSPSSSRHHVHDPSPWSALERMHPNVTEDRKSIAIRWHGDIVPVNVSSTSHRPSRSWGDKDTTRCTRLRKWCCPKRILWWCVHADTRTPHLHRGNTLCCKRTKSWKETVPRSRWACTVQRDAFGRPFRRQHGVIWRLPSTLKPLWQPYLAVSPCTTSRWRTCSVLARVRSAHFTGLHVWPALKAPPASHITVDTVSASSMSS